MRNLNDRGREMLERELEEIGAAMLTSFGTEAAMLDARYSYLCGQLGHNDDTDEDDGDNYRQPKAA